MSIKILMPALSPTMTDGNLVKWLIKEGDFIKAGKVIAEIETDKATMEIEAVDEGVVEQLLFIETDRNTDAVKSPKSILIFSTLRSTKISRIINKFCILKI